jgi:N-acetylmuramic acid 6-phosphate etherase
VVGIIAGGDDSLRVSSEGKEDDSQGVLPELLALSLNEKDTLIGIAAGGTTPYVRGGLEWATQLDSAPLTAMISCSNVSTPNGVDHMIVLETGPEVLTGSTRMKAGTATKLALNTISTTLMIQEGRVYGNLMVDVKASNEKLKDRAARIFSTITESSREEAFDWLAKAENELKPALVMKLCDKNLSDARLALKSLKFHELMLPSHRV